MCHTNENALTINFLGDSITEGHGASSVEKRYSSVTSRLLGAMEHNYGIAGTRIAPQTSVSENPRYDLDFNLRIERMTKQCNVVVVFGGTNDFGHGDAPFGEQEDQTESTFCGSVYSLFQKIKEKYPTQPVVVILPLHRREEDNPQKTIKLKGEAKLLIDYHDELARQAKNFGFYILDLWDEPMLNPHLEEGTHNFEDMLHPSDSGHQLLGELLAAYITKILNKEIVL